MGVVSTFMKVVGIVSLLLALLIGSAYSGALGSTGLFSFIDQYEGARGQFFKGMVPAFHAGTPWLFSEDQIPDLQGSTIVVTGANSGLGFWSARHLAANKATVVLTCRNAKRCAEAVQRIQDSVGSEHKLRLYPMQLDLASFTSIKAFVKDFKANFDRVDSLILNAGVMVPPFTRTAEGFEQQIGVNHFGHFLLTTLLLPHLSNRTHLSSTAPATIVAVSSAAHFDSYPEGIRDLAGMNDESSYDRAKAYGQSKLANVLFTQELAERVKDQNILVNAVHPGGVDTELGRHILEKISAVFGEKAGAWAEKNVLRMLPVWHPRDASLTQLYAAVSPQLKAHRVTGKYFHPIARLTKPDIHCQNMTLQKMLWDMSEQVIGPYA